MKEFIRVGAVIVNLKATPYIFVGDNLDRRGKLNKQYPWAVYCSSNSPYKGGRDTEWMVLKRFTNKISAWHWMVTYIFEEFFSPRLLEKWKPQRLVRSEG